MAHHAAVGVSGSSRSFRLLYVSLCACVCVFHLCIGTIVLLWTVSLLKLYVYSMLQPQCCCATFKANALSHNYCGCVVCSPPLLPNKTPPQTVLVFRSIAHPYTLFVYGMVMYVRCTSWYTHYFGALFV